MALTQLVWIIAIMETQSYRIVIKNKPYQQCNQNERFGKDIVLIESLIAKINDLICRFVLWKACQNLNNPLLQAKTYWSILKSFYNGRKVLLNPPLLIDDAFATDIQKKISIFNKSFADQCPPLNNASDLPTNQIFLAQSRLVSLNFNEGELLQIIRALNINNAHGHDDICIKMIKIHDRSLLKTFNCIV